MTSEFKPRVLRFAPSPNGFLHLGHAYSALFNQHMARRLGGRLLLRMENIDLERCRSEYEAAIVEDLDWLGVEFDAEPRRQCEHFLDYREQIDKLAARGLVYPCFCSRTDLLRAAAARRDAPRDPDGSPHYSGACKALSEEERERRASKRAPALRIDMARALQEVSRAVAWREYGEGENARIVHADPARWGDAVLVRRDVPASYHIAVVVDDAIQGVTDVVRGQDLFEATSLHRLLQELLGFAPPNYRHHELLRDEIGEKLSKRTRAKSIRSLRVQGMSAEDVKRRIGFEALEAAAHLPPV